MYVRVEFTNPVDQLAVEAHSEVVQFGAHPELLFEDKGASCHKGEIGYEVIGNAIAG